MHKRPNRSVATENSEEQIKWNTGCEICTHLSCHRHRRLVFSTCFKVVLKKKKDSDFAFNVNTQNSLAGPGNDSLFFYPTLTWAKHLSAQLILLLSDG